MKLHRIDLAIVLVYLVLVVAVGVWVKRRASKGIESYFLGARRLPWWMIAMSGSSSYFDITGTMWIVSMFVAYGFSGYWIQWMWGFLIAVFYFAYMGKWIRRSGVVTGAEWMVLRFGEGPGGRAARLAYTVFAILTLTAFIAYTAVGMGKFGVEFLPVQNWVGAAWRPYANQICAAAIIGVTGAYVVMGGFVGLTIVEFVQTILLTCGALLIAYIGYAAFDPASVAGALETLSTGTGRLVQIDPGRWYAIVPTWRTANPDDPYAMFGLVVLAFVAKGLLLGASGPEQLYDFQKFLATRNPREASLAGMLWGVFHTVRFPMATAIAVLGLLAVARQPAASFDPEKVLPHVIANVLPVGLTGLALAALLSAFMATFSAMVNGAASYLIRDIYQPYVYPAAGPSHLVLASKMASALMIVVGIVISFGARSIAGMLTWIMVYLGGGVLIPNVLRWYWWRLNGWGYAAGIFGGMGLSLAQALLAGRGYDYPVYVALPVLAGVCALLCLVVTWATAPTPAAVLRRFYEQTLPAGAWGRVEREVLAANPGFRRDQPFRRDLVNLIIGLPWLFALYVGPSYLIVHRWREFAASVVVVVVGAAVLSVTWYRGLPPRPAGLPPTGPGDRAADEVA